MARAKSAPARKVIKPGKDINASEADKLKQKLHNTATQGVKNVTLDFTGVKTIDPVGLSVIIAAQNTLAGSGGKLALKNVSDEFSSLFGTMRLDQHVELQ